MPGRLRCESSSGKDGADRSVGLFRVHLVRGPVTRLMLARISTEGLPNRNAFVHGLCSTLLTQRTAAFTLYELTNVLVIGYYEVCWNVLY